MQHFTLYYCYKYLTYIKLHSICPTDDIGTTIPIPVLRRNEFKNVLYSYFESSL